MAVSLFSFDPEYTSQCYRKSETGPGGLGAAPGPERFLRLSQLPGNRGRGSRAGPTTLANAIALPSISLCYIKGSEAWVRVHAPWGKMPQMRRV